MEVSNTWILETEQKLQQALQPKRYVHTIGVAYMAASLAMAHGADAKAAFVAGLLHDCAKNIPEDELLLLCREKQIVLSEYEQKLPQLVHAVYGAYLAKEVYGVEDEEILSAIRFHTVGRPAMTKTEQVVFLADYLEIGRTQPTEPSLHDLRKYAFDNLNKATYLVTLNTVRYLESTGQEVDPATYATFEYYRNQYKETIHGKSKTDCESSSARTER